MWAMPMPLVAVKDKGGHLWATADVEGLHTGTTARVKVRDLWATPMVMVDDEGHKLLEACFGNPIGGKGTFGATNHPNTRTVAQSTLDYWNNEFDLCYKLVRIVGATWTILGAFRSKYLISMEIAKSEEDKPTKFFVRTYESFITGADSNELSFSVCVPWDTYVLRTPKPLVKSGWRRLTRLGSIAKNHSLCIGFVCRQGLIWLSKNWPTMLSLRKLAASEM